MYTLFILFLASLLGIIVMIWRKLTLLENGHVVSNDRLSFKIPHLEKLKDVSIRNLKKYGHMGLVETLRFYLKSTKILQTKYEEIKIKIKNINAKNPNQSDAGSAEKAEASKFLKMISDYKHKIRMIKHKIKEEENL